MKNDKVSIIVPIYNVEKYLSTCLDSLINQTHKNIDIWAISDGSPDDSVSIIKKYQKKDKRIRCIEKENGGYGSVLEYAIKNITTDYFIICDPDDWMREDTIETLYNKAIKNNLDLVVGCKYLVYSDDGKEEYSDTLCHDLKIFAEEDKVYTKDEGLTGAFTLMPSPHAKLYRTKLAKKIVFPHKVSYTDLLLYLVYLTNCKRMMFTKEPLVYYLVDRPGNTTTDINPKRFNQHYEVFKSIFEQIDGKSVPILMYSYLLMEFKSIASLLRKINDEEAYNEKCKLVKKMLDMCKKYKKQINNNTNYFTNKNYIYNYLLLNNITSNIMFNKLVKK